MAKINRLGRQSAGPAGARAGRGALIGRRRTIIFAAAQISTIWILAACIIWIGYREDLAAGRETARSTSLTVAGFTGQTLRSTDLVLRSIQDWVEHSHIDTEGQFRQVMSDERFSNALRDRIVGVPQINVAVIAALNGDVINSTMHLAGAPRNIADREAFRTQVADNAPALSLTATARNPAGRLTFYMARRAFSQSGVPLGVLVAGIDVDYLCDMFRQASPAGADLVTLFRQDGVVLATTAGNAGAIGKRLPNATSLRAVREGRAGSVDLATGPRLFDSSSDEPRLVAGQLVPQFPVVVSVAIRQSVYLAGWNEQVRLCVGIAAVLTALTFFIARVFLRLLARNESTARLAAERRILSSLIDTPSALCALLNRQGEVIYANRRFSGVFADLTGTASPFEDPGLSGGRDVLEFARSDQKGSLELDLRQETVGGGTRYLRVSLSRQALPGLGDCVVMIGHDETERYQTQQTVMQSAKLATLGELTTGMAHELTQPLNVMRIAAQNALMELEPTEAPAAAPKAADSNGAESTQSRSFVANKLNRIIAQVDRAADIVSRMRIFGRTPMGPPTHFDARGACRSAIALIDSRARGAGVVINTRLGDRPLMLSGYQNLLEMVLVSLLLNAKDALETSDQASKTIDVAAARSESGNIRLTVSDNGPGVPPDLRDRIFEPFFTGKPSGKGAGLGLATSFGIVRDAGGSLSLLPTSRGATFQVELPEAA